MNRTNRTRGAQEIREDDPLLSAGGRRLGRDRGRGRGVTPATEEPHEENYDELLHESGISMADLAEMNHAEKSSYAKVILESKQDYSHDKDFHTATEPKPSGVKEDSVTESKSVDYDFTDEEDNVERLADQPQDSQPLSQQTQHTAISHPTTNNNDVLTIDSDSGDSLDLCKNNVQTRPREVQSDSSAVTTSADLFSSPGRNSPHHSSPHRSSPHHSSPHHSSSQQSSQELLAASSKISRQKSPPPPCETDHSPSHSQSTVDEPDISGNQTLVADDDDATQALSPMALSEDENDIATKEKTENSSLGDASDQESVRKRKAVESDLDNFGSPPTKRPVLDLPNQQEVTDKEDEGPPPMVNKMSQSYKWYDGHPMFSPAGCDWKVYARVIAKRFELYRVQMREAQSRFPCRIPWGKPIAVGRHCENTIDLKKRGQATYGRRLEDSDEEREAFPGLIVWPPPPKQDKPKWSVQGGTLGICRNPRASAATSYAPETQMNDSDDDDFIIGKGLSRIRKRQKLTVNKKAEPDSVPDTQMDISDSETNVHQTIEPGLQESSNSTNSIPESKVIVPKTFYSFEKASRSPSPSLSLLNPVDTPTIAPLSPEEIPPSPPSRFHMQRASRSNTETPPDSKILTSLIMNQQDDDSADSLGDVIDKMARKHQLNKSGAAEDFTDGPREEERSTRSGRAKRVYPVKRKVARGRTRVIEASDSEKDGEEIDTPLTSPEKKGRGTPKQVVQLVPCPLCSKSFPPTTIEDHAATCDGCAPPSPESTDPAPQREPPAVRPRRTSHTAAAAAAAATSTAPTSDEDIQVLKVEQSPAGSSSLVAETLRKQRLNLQQQRTAAGDDLYAMMSRPDAEESSDEWEPDDGKQSESEDEMQQSDNEPKTSTRAKLVRPRRGGIGGQAKRGRPRQPRGVNAVQGNKMDQYFDVGSGEPAGSPEKEPPLTGPTSACPMCCKKVPLDLFPEHVQHCVDSAEAEAVAAAVVPEAEPEVNHRPLRRRPLHQVAAPTTTTTDLFELSDSGGEGDGTGGRARFQDGNMNKRFKRKLLMDDNNKSTLASGSRGVAAATGFKEMPRPAAKSGQHSVGKDTAASAKAGRVDDEDWEDLVNSPIKSFTPVSEQKDGLLDFEHQFEGGGGRGRKGVKRKNNSQRGAKRAKKW